MGTGVSFGKAGCVARCVLPGREKPRSNGSNWSEHALAFRGQAGQGGDLAVLALRQLLALSGRPSGAADWSAPWQRADID